MELIAYTTTCDVIVKMSIGEYIKFRNKLYIENDQLNYGERVKDARNEMRLTQHELADMLGISRNYLSQIERGIANNLSARIVKVIEFQCGVRL